MSESNIDLTERLVRRRARVSIVSGLLFLANGANGLNADVLESRPQGVYISAWLVWAAALLLLIALGGGLLRGQKVRGLLNDESTHAHRLSAITAGFWTATLVAFVVYGITLFEPMSARIAVRLILTAAVTVSAVRFGLLELRSLKNG